MIPQTLPKFFWFFSKQHKVCLICLIAIAFLWAASISLTPYTLKLLIDSMIAADLNSVSASRDIWFAGLIYISVTFGTALVIRIYDWAMIKMIPKMKIQIVNEVFAHLEQHSFSYFQQNFAGTLASKINDIGKGASTIVFFLIDQFFTRILSFMIGSLTMFFVNPKFSWILILWSTIFITLSVILSKISQKYSEDYSHSRSMVTGKIVDSISNILNVKLFAREKYEKNRLQFQLDDLVFKDCRLQWFLMKVKSFYALSITILTGGMIWLLITERLKGQITIGDAALILTLTSALVRDIYQIASQLVVFSEEVGNCKQALSIISPQYEIVNRENNPPLKITQGRIIYQNVNFKYPKGQDLFVETSVTIDAGSKIGLVGYSGGGKTTFVNLLVRLFPLDSGKITIDGQDIHTVSQESLREQIALIPQEPLLFHRTLMENIRYGRLDATDEEVIACAKKACCHDFIMNLSMGYESLVGERGIKLSGGQRQRIIIARAMLKNASIIIIDEATSSLDSVTESSIHDSLRALMKDKTTIMIAHRLSTLLHMDRILVFNNGKIVEDGYHAKLIQLNGYYSSLWNMQANGMIKDQQIEENEGQIPPYIKENLTTSKDKLSQLLELSNKTFVPTK
jgi:ATP-binding cassette, subfamily B, bacterial